MSPPRLSPGLTGIGAGLLLLSLVLALTSSRAGATEGAKLAPPGSFPADSTVIHDESFSYVGRDVWTHLPEGATAADVVAIGGRGASISGKPGGRPHRVAARIEVAPQIALHMLIGGDGVGGTGGFNGGGSGGSAGWSEVSGGGGGGATDIRTIWSGAEGTLESRILVAAGGGGAGSATGFNNMPGAQGGDAASPGARAASATPENTVGSGGYGGGAGTAAEGGAGGYQGYVYPNGTSGDGHPGSPGALFSGGSGGLGSTGSGAGHGGGGGGGLFGGGGGGGGIHEHFSPTTFLTGGGGGGGGSSLVPAGGSIRLAEVGEEPGIAIHLTVPGTQILSGPAEHVNATAVGFEFESTEAGSALECSLDQEESFESCDPIVDYENLSPGTHTFRARSVNTMGNVDPTPAVWEFVVDLEAPTTAISSGPSGDTSDPRPVFEFTAGEPQVRFECRFDSDAFTACSGASTHGPAAALAMGSHRFEVRAIDRAGNVGPPSSRDFRVKPPSSGPGNDSGAPGGPSTRAQIRFGRVKLNRRKGFAILPVQVSGTGTVRLLKNKRLRPARVRSTRRKPVLLRVRPTRRFAGVLTRRGRLAVRVRVGFQAVDGGRAFRSRKLTLRRTMAGA